MATTLNPYLNWRSSAREAMEFYHSVFGGELTASTFKEFGMPVEPGEEELIMHSQLVTPELTLMGADTPSHMPLAENPNGSVSLSGNDSVDFVSSSSRMRSRASAGESAR